MEKLLQKLVELDERIQELESSLGDFQAFQRLVDEYFSEEVEEGSEDEQSSEIVESEE